MIEISRRNKLQRIDMFPPLSQHSSVYLISNLTTIIKSNGAQRLMITAPLQNTVDPHVRRKGICYNLCENFSSYEPL